MNAHHAGLALPGYDTAAIAKKARHEGTTLREVALTPQASAADFDACLVPAQMVHPDGE